MARVTVEDCILNVPNRFDLVILAAQRAKQISAGNPLTVDRDNDKDAVVALREIAEKTVEIEKLREDVVQSFSKRQAPEVMDKETEEKQPLSKEIEETFAETQRQAAEEQPEADSDKPMSFAQDNIEVED